MLYERALAEALAAELQEEKELAAAQASRFLQTMLTHTITSAAQHLEGTAPEDRSLQGTAGRGQRQEGPARG